MRIVLPALLAALLLLVGCEEKVTLENYEQIEKGMTLAQVEQILGEGRLEESSGTSLGTGGIPERSRDDVSNRTYVWEEDGKIITVKIIDDKVASKTKRGF